MFKLMQKRSLELAAKELKSQDSSGDSPTGNGASSETPVEDSIREKLTRELNPEQLIIVNESGQHAGHAGNPNNDPETHFKVEVVSTEFEGANSVKRHRMVFAILKDELAGPVHALTLKTHTPTES